MFQFALLLVLTGFLLSLAIVSRLMEVAITLIYPTSIFLVQQLVKLFVVSIRALDVIEYLYVYIYVQVYEFAFSEITF